MGWIAGGSVIQQQIIALYDAGVLTPTILDAIMKPFDGSDADTAGFDNTLVAKNGKSVEEIICMVMEYGAYVYAVEQLPKDAWLKKLKPQDRNFAKSEVGYRLFNKFWHKRWNIN